MISALIYTAVFALIIWHMPWFSKGPVKPGTVAVFFILKVMAGMVVTWIYTYYYTHRPTADIYKYFDDARIMYDALWDKPEDYFRMVFGVGNDNEYFSRTYYDKMYNWFRIWETVEYNDNRTIIRWNAAVMLFSGGNFHVHTIFMCVFSLIGTWFIYLALHRFLPETKKLWFVICLFLFPSYLFWTSGVLKEGLLMFGAGIIIYLIFESVDKRLRWYHWCLGAASVYLLLYLKMYFFLAIIPVFTAFILVKTFRIQRVWLVYACVFIAGIIGLTLLPMFYEQYHMGALFKQKQDNFYGLAAFSGSGSVIDIPRLTGTYTDLWLKCIPAFFNGLFRPLPGESFSPLILISSIETLLPVALVIYLLVKRPTLTANEKNMVFFLVGFMAILMVLSGLVTPVLGALVRYRVPCWPFIVFLAIYFFPEKTIPRYFKKV